jgi:hypothetical protein
MACGYSCRSSDYFYGPCMFTSTINTTKINRVSFPEMLKRQSEASRNVQVL